jgi:hypothetical protein
MIDHVETRLAARIVGAADIDQHREAFAAQTLERRAHVGRRHANDARVADVCPNGSWVEGSAPGRGSL